LLAIQVPFFNRQWLVNHFNTWAEEENECLKLIEQDCYNNSSWNQLYFCSSHSIKNDPKTVQNVVDKQISFAIEELKLQPDNECPFSYIRGMLQLVQKSLDDFPKLKELLLELSEKDNRFSLDLLMQYSAEDTLKCKQYAAKLLKVDLVRKNYWQYRLNSV
jgi:protein farnesyltransferase/geranylgeranyltransferase type-1 subunit alpha